MYIYHYLYYCILQEQTKSLITVNKFSYILLGRCFGNKSRLWFLSCVGEAR